MYKECISTNLWLVDFSFRLVNVMHHLPIGSLAPLGKWAFFLSRDIKQRQAARTPCVVFVIASHYQSLRIIVLLLQTCLLGSEVLSPTLLLQQLHMHRLQQDRRFRLFASLVSCFLKTDSVASFLRETVEMFSQILFRWKDGLATFLYCNFCALGKLCEPIKCQHFRSKFGGRRGIFQLKIFRIPLFSTERWIFPFLDNISEDIPY